MARKSLSRVVRPLPKGQITIPVGIRKALGIDESSLLEVSLEGDRIMISKLEARVKGPFRVYLDEEIERFLEEDKITPEAAERVRELMRAGLV